MKSIITCYPYLYKGVYYPADFILIAVFNPVAEDLKIQKIHDFPLAQTDASSSKINL